MSAQHRWPLLAFVLVSLTCAGIVVNGLHAGAVRALTRVTARVPVAAQPVPELVMGVSLSRRPVGRPAARRAVEPATTSFATKPTAGVPAPAEPLLVAARPPRHRATESGKPESPPPPTSETSSTSGTSPPPSTGATVTGIPAIDTPSTATPSTATPSTDTAGLPATGPLLTARTVPTGPVGTVGTLTDIGTASTSSASPRPATPGRARTGRARAPKAMETVRLIGSPSSRRTPAGPASHPTHLQDHHHAHQGGASGDDAHPGRSEHQSHGRRGRH